MSHTHQNKKAYAGARSQNQSAITSFFSPASASPADAPVSAYAAPILPPAIQSNLLNVGMRIRKSVPEGYKTGSYSAFTLFSDTTVPTTTTTITTTTMAPSAPITSTSPKTRPRSGNRELTPFCGSAILRVGGMSSQQWGAYSPENETEDVPLLTSSQGSVGSEDGEVSTPVGGNKRRFLEEEEADDGVVVMGGISPLGILGETRRLAVPRRKKTWSGNGKLPAHAGQVRIFGQENSGVGVAGDFEDADFLDYELAGEVEMSGCN
ncbi:ribonucleotide reductase inhibitor [Drepanopeziza brunnea f. sp. 'multigermtubi' MB_m1]|uniref:Ribonucleotide reductase inhibitor n=1 Tax=Marssonina brunnea f. sp. multigermtubi (strain MB_m1) TaxID=1072389 RepID=K1XUP4_MARBU|nr:ribonucleotide reductase inhibitor [Drepanopeziza brunnea f. sp. 'multigermtubi' MB_m1]EKD16459.1 ribonucleotide reductase inhibitor [Drepanopeziza brunnea f. sp. 'multigermtubi' MB_m1]